MGSIPQHAHCAPNTFTSHFLLIAFIFTIVALQSTLAFSRYHRSNRVERGVNKRTCNQTPNKVWCGRSMGCQPGNKCDGIEDCNNTAYSSDMGKDERGCLKGHNNGDAKKQRNFCRREGGYKDLCMDCEEKPNKVWCGGNTKCIPGKRCDLIEDCNISAHEGKRNFSKDESGCLRVKPSVDIVQGATGPKVRKGGEVTLTCRFHERQNHDYNSTHIVWYEKKNGVYVLQPREEYEIVDNETVSLHLTNLTRLGTRQYYCMFEHMTTDKVYLGGGIHVYVGIPPETPILKCANSNFETVSCYVASSIESGVYTNFTLEYRFLHTEEGDSPSWQEDKERKRDGRGWVFSIDGIADNGEELHIRAMESNYFGQSEYAEIASYIIREELKPSPVENFVVSNRTSTSLKLSWAAPSDLHSSTDPTEHYGLSCEMEYSNVNNPAENGTATIQPYTPTMHQLTGLTPQSTYNVKIRCYIDKSKRSNWAEVRGTTLQDAPGGTVQSLNYTSEVSRRNVFERYITLTWQNVPAEKQYGEILGYEVYYVSASGNDTRMVKTTELSVTIGGLQRFQEYTVNVNAYSRWGAGPNDTITLKDETTAPTSLQAEGIDLKVDLKDKTNSSLKVSWGEATSPSGIITKYELQWMPVEKGQWSEIVELQNVHEYEIKNLEFFTEYYVRMTITNSEGTSDWRRFEPVYTAGGAPTPPLLQDPETLSASKTKLHWEPPVQSYNEPVLYHVRYRPVPKEGQPTVDWQRASQTEDHDIKVSVNCSLVKGKNGSPFEFEVRAVTVRGESTAVTKHLEMCDESVAMVVWISILSVLFGLCFIGLIVCCCKQSDFTKPSPDPIFIDVCNDPKFQWDGERNAFKQEKEKFDTLTSADSYTELLAPVIERMSSKDSSSASTDQGIHDMDIDSDSVDLKSSAPPTNNANNVTSKRCNRYSSGTGQSIVSECGANGGGQVCNRSASNPGMEVLSEDYEDAVFEESDDLHTYGRAALNPSPPLTPNEEGIGSSSSLLSSGSTGPHSLPPYSQMGYNPHQRLSSSGSDSSGVNYHMMGSQGLAPINGKDTNDAGSSTYSKLSQIPTSPSPPPDTVVDVDHPATASDEDVAPEYHQMGLRDPGQQERADNSADDNQLVAPNNNNEKSPNHFNSIPTVDIGSFVQPHNEFIVATAHIMPTHPQPKVETKQKKPEGALVKPSQSEATNDDNHSYSVVGRNNANWESPRNSPPVPCAPAKITDSGYVPNGCPSGFSIPNGMPITKPQHCNNGYVPHNSPPTQGGFLGSQSQSPNRVHSPPRGTTDGYAPATPVAMSAIMRGKPLTNDGYVPNTTVV